MPHLGTLRRSTTSPVVSGIAAGSLSAFLCPMTTASLPRPIHTATPNRPRQKASPRPAPDMDALFIQALVRAGTCRHHAKRFYNDQNSPPSEATAPELHRRGQHTNSSTESDSDRLTHRGVMKGLFAKAKTDLRALVGYYEGERRPKQRGMEDEWIETEEVGREHEPWEARDPSDVDLINKIEELLTDPEASHEALYDCYKYLPFPGVAYLRLSTIRDLMRHLSIVEEKDQTSMQRFLSIMDDMKAANIPITVSEWSSAIAFAGRCMRRVSADEVEAALYVWNEMEKAAGVRGTTVTFNILFDIAVKAGKYSLAEMMLKEMQARRLRLSRYSHLGLIYYHGLRQDGSSVRQAYQDLVSAGEFVDTGVMNTVMTSLLRAGEPAAAEQVFARMRAMHKGKPSRAVSPQTWRSSRSLSLYLDRSARILSNGGEPKVWKKLQDSAPIAPDTRTYGLLVRYHAATAGNIDRVDELLREMKANTIPLDGTIFMVIFYGFINFGGVRYSSWTRDRLEAFWREYAEAVKLGVRRTYYSTLMVQVALRAFAKCSDPERTMQVWEDVRERWRPAPDEADAVSRTLRTLLPRGTDWTYKPSS